ncbi:hypothetical protein OROGR_029046 [Orobanche gracilis]
MILAQHIDVPIGNAAIGQSENIYDNRVWAVENQETTIEGTKNNRDGTVKTVTGSCINRYWFKHKPLLGGGNVALGQENTSVGVEAPHYDAHIVLDHNTREGGNQSQWTTMLRDGNFHIPIIEQGDKKDSVDSDLYLMRHMEMFMGEVSAKWETGISIMATKQITTLRIRYCGELMCWEDNIVKEQVLTKAQLCYNDICAYPIVKIEKLLM